jgi:hypothetical protein
VKRRMVRNLLVLAAEAERQIRAAGRPLPPRDQLLAALAPSAKAVTAASRHLDQSARLHARAEAMAHEAVDGAAVTVRSLVAAWAEAVPPEPRWREFDPSLFRVSLEPVGDRAGLAGEPARAGDAA